MNMNEEKRLNFRNCLIQFVFYLAGAASFAYSATYLSYLGYSASFIGILMAVGNIMCTVLLPVLGNYIDQRKQTAHRYICYICLICCLLALAMLLLPKISAVVIVGTVVIFGCCYAMMSLLNTLSFSFKKQGIVLNFGLARGIGSLSYATNSLLIGYALKAVVPTRLLPILFMLSYGLLIPLVATFHTDRPVIEDQGKQPEPVSTAQFLNLHRSFLLFMLATMILFFNHQVINNFMIQFMRNIGGDSSSVGVATFIAAGLELISMLSMNRLKEKIDIRILLTISGIFFTLKVFLSYLAPNVGMFYLAQTLQMFAYGINYPAAVYYADASFNQADAIKANALITSSQTLGGVLASVIGGLSIDLLGEKKTLLIVTVISAFGSIFMYLSTMRKRKA